MEPNRGHRQRQKQRRRRLSDEDARGITETPMKLDVW